MRNPSFLWSDGSTGSSISVSQTGTYSVQVTDGSFGTCSTSTSNFVEVTISPDTVNLSMAHKLIAAFLMLLLLADQIFYVTIQTSLLRW